MERYASFGGDPVGVGKVGLIDDQGIALPTAYGVSAIRRRHIVAMLPSVGRNDLETVIRLRQHDDELRSLHDLSNAANVKQAHTQSAEGCGQASKRRIILIA